MSAQVFKEYRPGISAYAQRVTPDDWDRYRYLVTYLHNQHATKRMILAELNRCGFNPSMGQLVSQMKKWDLTAYGPRTGGQAGTAADHKLAQSEASLLRDSVATTDDIFPRSNRNLAATKSTDLVLKYNEPMEGLAYNGPNVPVSSVASSGFGGSGEDLDGGSTTTQRSTSDHARDGNKQQILARTHIATRGIRQHGSLGSVELCCCVDFLTGSRRFKGETAFYTACLRRYNRPSDLVHISLLRQCILTNQGSPVDPYVWGVFQETLQYYIGLAERSGVSNSTVDRVLGELSQMYEIVMNEPLVLQSTKFGRPHLKWHHWIEETSKVRYSEVPNKLNCGPSRIYQSFLRWMNKPNDMYLCKALESCGRKLWLILPHLLKLFPLDLCAQDSGGINDLAIRSTLEKVSDLIAEILGDDQELRSSFHDIEHQSAPNINAFPISDHELRLLFRAIALFVIIRIRDQVGTDSWSHLPQVVVSDAVQRVSHELVGRSWNGLTMRYPLLNLIRFVWICDIDASGFTYEELHYGYCSQQGLWNFLGRDVSQDDIERKAVEEEHPLNNLQRREEKHQTDMVDVFSIMSSSTDSSFGRFRKFARSIESHLKSRSLLSLSSGRMSLDSWRLPFPSEFEGEREDETGYTPAENPVVWHEKSVSFSAKVAGASIGYTHVRK